MEAGSLLQSFAIAKNGRIVSVEEVERGQACECTCPCCHGSLIARQGDVRVWHFAHATGADCEGGAESALHLAAKAVIERAGGIMLPSMSVKRTHVLADGRRATADASRPDTWVDLYEVKTEVDLGTVIPDVIGRTADAAYLIEVGVTHFVDSEKLAMLQDLGSPAIEIDLRKFDREAWTWATLEDVVVQGVEGKRWLVYPDRGDLEALAIEKARLIAMAQPEPLQTQPQPAQEAHPRPARTRYRVQGRIIDLIDFPFGVALWSPYDAHFNEVIKGWSRAYGGRYQPNHRNWLFPTAAKSFLTAEIAKRQ